NHEAATGSAASASGTGQGRPVPPWPRSGPGGALAGPRSPPAPTLAAWLAGGTVTACPPGPRRRPATDRFAAPRSAAVLAGRGRRGRHQPPAGAHSKEHAQRHDSDREPPAVVGDGLGRDDRVVT